MAYHRIPLVTPLAQMPAPAICTNQYSSLQQQRLYLLSALADEEDRGERLTRAFEALSSKLTKLESADPPKSPPKLRQTIRGIRHKIGDCQQRERALADNLAQIVAHMEGLKRYQWRAAQQTYAQQHQHGQMMVMSPGFGPGFALQSPVNVDLVPDMQYLSVQHPLGVRSQQQYAQPYSTMNAYSPPYVNPQMSTTPVLLPQPQHGSSVDFSSLHPGSPAETYTSSEIEELTEAISPCDLSFLRINSHSLQRSNSGGSKSFDHSRESTITVADLQDSSTANIHMSPGSKSAANMTTRSSILVTTSAGIRLNRKAYKGQQSA